MASAITQNHLVNKNNIEAFACTEIDIYKNDSIHNTVEILINFSLPNFDELAKKAQTEPNHLGLKLKTIFHYKCADGTKEQIATQIEKALTVYNKTLLDSQENRNSNPHPTFVFCVTVPPQYITSEEHLAGQSRKEQH